MTTTFHRLCWLPDAWICPRKVHCSNPRFRLCAAAPPVLSCGLCAFLFAIPRPLLSVSSAVLLSRPCHGTTCHIIDSSAIAWIYYIIDQPRAPSWGLTLDCRQPHHRSAMCPLLGPHTTLQTATSPATSSISHVPSWGLMPHCSQPFAAAALFGHLDFQRHL